MSLSLNQDSLERGRVIDLGYYFHLIKNRWISILIFTLLSTTISILVVMSIRPTYKATATLLIESSQNKAISIEEVVGIDTRAKEYYLTQFEILKSNQVAKRVIDKLNLIGLEEFNTSLVPNSVGIVTEIKNHILSHPLVSSYLKTIEKDPNQALVEDAEYRKVLQKFKSKLTISPIRKTQLVNISFESFDPQLASTIANEVGLAFIENNLESKLVATEQATGWINQRVNELKEQLARSEQALLSFLQQQELIDDSGIVALTSSELSNLTNRIAKATDKRIETQALYDALRDSRNADVSTLSSISLISNHPQIRDIRLAESNAEKQVSELAKRYGPKHDKMIQANAQLNTIQKRAKKIVQKLINGIESELQSAKSQERLLKNELLSKKDEFQSLSVVKREYDALKREVDTNAKLYDLFLTRQKETSATSDFSAANARFSDYALTPEYPNKPNKKLIVVLTVLVSASLAILIVFIQDALNNTVENARDMENKLGILPTGTLPIIKDKVYRKKPLDLHVFDNSKFGCFQESVDSIRVSLLINLQRDNRKILAVSSSIPGEGKTTTSVSLAQSFSKLEKVLLIDCDLRKGSVAERFSLPKNRPGLSNHLMMGCSLDECIEVVDGHNLSLLTAGMMIPNPQEMLGSQKFEKLLGYLSTKYDRIVIDTPPILPVKDAFIIGKLSKGIILVLKANSTSNSVYKHTMTLFTRHEINIDGVVLNQVKLPKKGKHTYTEYTSYS
ncbi:ATPase [Vibrio sinaloensis]|uniref:GumC family protein n=1 Tax=Photobacterium sp. (strain ATCC 43367) TaxID=379097 RepID=UPI00057FAA8C|nr:polysaccharide biosynthesis tyrosine autokinase [Vibrio sinaloensis]KIE21838.1 ATPase [Vibrio sinaloensis]